MDRKALDWATEKGVKMRHGKMIFMETHLGQHIDDAISRAVRLAKRLRVLSFFTRVHAVCFLFNGHWIVVFHDSPQPYVRKAYEECLRGENKPGPYTELLKGSEI